MKMRRSPSKSRVTARRFLRVRCGVFLYMVRTTRITTITEKTAKGSKSSE